MADAVGDRTKVRPLCEENEATEAGNRKWTGGGGGGGGGAAGCWRALTPRCLGTSPYVCPGKGHSVSSSMLSESVSHQFPLFLDPILLDTGASGAPQLSFLLIPIADGGHTSGKVEHSTAQ